MSRSSLVTAMLLLVANAAGRAQTLEPSGEPHAVIQNAAGVRVFVATENTDPTLRIAVPGEPVSERSFPVLFPEHVTVVRHGSTEAEHLYLFRAGVHGGRPQWRSVGQSLEYERDLPHDIHMLARSTLEYDGVRFHYEFTNRSAVSYGMVYPVTDPRLVGIFHYERLERTYVHHADGLDLLASETPSRLTMPLDQWLPARYLVSLTFPIPLKLVERRDDGITYYNKSRKVDLPFIATRSMDGRWVIASFARQAGNVWSNPELTCQHVDPQSALPPGAKATLEVKLLVMRGSLDDAMHRASAQRQSLR